VRLYEEPVLAKLIVDREFMVAECEMNPGFGYVIRSKTNDGGARKQRNVIADDMPGP
jgi:hypothetical protein